MIARRFLCIGALWFLACVALGTYMGATHQFTDKQVHVHGNLLGWVSCTLFALVHRSWPSLAASAAAKAHFWLHNTGLVVFILGLALLPRGLEGAEPLLGLGSIVLLVATGLFAYAVWHAEREMGQLLMKNGS